MPIVVGTTSPPSPPNPFLSGMAGVLARGRIFNESLMTDVCQITRPGTGDPVFNPDTGQYDDPAPVTVYEGKCRIPAINGALTRNGGADQAFEVGEFPLDLPLDGDGYTAGETLAPGQTVTYMAAPNNPALEGMVFGLTAPMLSSQQTRVRWRMKTTVAQ